MRQWIEKIFTKNIAGSIPPRSLHVTTDPYHSESDDDDPTHYIKDPTTSGRIYPQDSLTTIYRFIADASNDSQRDADLPIFEFEDFVGTRGIGRKHLCTVNLRSGLPVDKVLGPPGSSASEARRLACFQACSDLFGRNLLSYRFFPLPPYKQLEVNHDGTIAAKEGKTAGTRSYIRKLPDFWKNCDTGARQRLYPTVIVPMFKADNDGLYAPMVLLTWQPLPDMPSCKLFFSGVANYVEYKHGAPFEPNEDQLRKLHLFTLRVCRSVANKAFECPLEKMSYFFAPLPVTWTISSSDQYDLPNIFDSILWDLVSVSGESAVVAFNKDSHELMIADLKNSIIQDRWVEFTRRYDAIQLRPDLNPLSHPADSLVCDHP